MSDLITDYQDGLVEVTDEAEAQLAAIYDRFAAGDIDHAEAHDLLVAVITAAAVRATMMAEVAAAAWLTGLDRADVLPIGTGPVIPFRVGTAVDRVLRVRGGVTSIAQTMRATAYDSASEAWSTFIRERAPRKKWRRRVESSKCPVCNGLADGKELLMTTTMYRHTGCRCVQEPITEGGHHE